MTCFYQPPLLLWPVAFAAGAAAHLFGAPEWSVAVIAFAFAAVGAGCATGMAPDAKLRRTNTALLLLTPILFGVGLWRGDSAGWAETSLSHAHFGAQPVVLQGVVSGQPAHRATGLDARIDVTAVNLGGERRRVADRVQLLLPAETRIERGDRVEIRATLTPTVGGAADNGYLGWLAAQGVAATGVVHPGDVVVIPAGARNGWRSAVDDARDAINGTLRAALPPPLAGLAQGMVSGERHATDGRLRDDLNTTSLSHLIVVSGANLTLLTAIFMAGSGWLVGRRAAASLAIVGALAYAAFAGGEPPVLRALGIALVFTLAHLLGRGRSAIDAVAIAAGVMIALDPQILRDVSFQLTLAGTLGLVLFMPSLVQRQLAGADGVRAAVIAVALVSLVAMLATMPLIAWHFQRVSLIGLLANIVVAPLFAWMFLGSFAVGIVGLASETIAGIISWPLAWLPLRWLQLVAETGSQVPGAALAVRDFGPLHAAVIYLAILAAAVRPRRERVARWSRTNVDAGDDATQPVPSRPMALLATAVALSLVAAVLWFTAVSHDDQLTVHFIDVGQGEAALIVTPDRETILIDTGGQPEPLLTALRNHLPSGTRRIDLLIVTHPQTDHVGSTWALLERYDIVRVAASRQLEQTALGQNLAETAESRLIPVTPIEAGMQISFGDDPLDLQLDVLWPPKRLGVTGDLQNDPNATGVVVRLRYGDAAILFAADLGATQEIALAQRSCSTEAEPCLLRADVLKVAHHGSRYSTTRLLLDRVRPGLAVISAGRGNPHGHPHAETVGNLMQSGATVVTTAERGTISLRTDGASIVWSTQH